MSDIKDLKKVYICSSLKPENFNYVSELLKKLPKAIYLRPFPEELTKPTKRYDTVEADIAMMQHADEIWCVGRLGRDCMVEIGYAIGIGKTIRVLVDDTNRDQLKDDWMILHGETKGILTFYEKPEDFGQWRTNFVSNFSTYT